MVIREGAGRETGQGVGEEEGCCGERILELKGELQVVLTALQIYAFCKIIVAMLAAAFLTFQCCTMGQSCDRRRSGWRCRCGNTCPCRGAGCAAALPGQGSGWQSLPAAAQTWRRWRAWNLPPLLVGSWYSAAVKITLCRSSGLYSR